MTDKIHNAEDVEKTLDLFASKLHETLSRVSRVEADVKDVINRLEHSPKLYKFDPSLVFQAALAGACLGMIQTYSVPALLENPFLLERVSEQVLKFAEKVAMVYEQNTPQVV